MPARAVPLVAVLSLALLSLLGEACDVPPAGGRIETIALHSGAVYPRRLQGEKVHGFRFHTGSRRFLHLAVDQRGVDVMVFLRDPAGRLVFEVDSPIGKTGEEPVFAVTQVAGDYLLQVEPFAAGAKGSYALEVKELRPAQGTDEIRAAAEESYARAERRRLQGKLEEAVAAYREALPRLGALADPRIALAQWHLGQELDGGGELAAAAAALEQAVARFRGEAERLGEARALNDLGGVRRRLGDTQGALTAHQRALALYRELGNVQGTATSLNNVGLVLETRGDLEGAIHHYEEALALWRRLGAGLPQAAPLENLGSLYSLLGHDQAALDLLQQARNLLVEEKNPRKRASILVALGWAEYLAGYPERALDRYREALGWIQRSGDRMAEAGLWDRRGSALRKLRRFPEAAASYEHALDLTRAVGSRFSEGHTLANLGWLDLETGAPARARERLARAVDLLVASGDPNGEVYARTGLSRAERLLGALGPAQREAQAAVRRVEQLRAGLRGPASRGQFFATRFDAYEELVTLLMDLDRREPGRGHARAALETAERARARNLLEAIGAETPAQPAAGEPRRRALAAEIQALEERRQVLVDENPRDPRRKPIEAELRERWLELDRLTRPAPPGAVRPSLRASEIQALAGDRTLLLVYQLAEPASFAWTIDRKSIVAHVLPGRERIEKLARRAAEGVSQSPGIAAYGAVDAALRELSDAILAPLAPRLAGRPRLKILADGALHLVPFAALPVTGEPLVVRHEIAMIPSAAVLLAQRRRLAGRRPAQGWVAALADPVFTRDDDRLRIPQGGPVDAGDENLRRGASYPGPLERLPCTADEAGAILRLVPPGQALVATGTAASRDLVTSGALRRYRILHFATHGILDTVLPERSGIVLSRFDERGLPRPGFLSAPALAELDLPAELAILSGCETGLGREMRGEGLVGLTHAFFRAGTRSVIVSLWKIRDQSTAQLMARLYQGLLDERLSPAAALRAAQLSLRQQERWRAPYYWAGFSLQGDSR